MVSENNSVVVDSTIASEVVELGKGFLLLKSFLGNLLVGFGANSLVICTLFSWVTSNVYILGSTDNSFKG